MSDKYDDLLIRFSSLKMENDILLFDNSPFMKHIKQFNGMNYSEVKDFRYMLTTFNQFYPNVKGRLENSFVELVDVDAVTASEREIAFNYYSSIGKQPLCIILNKLDKNFNHKYGFQILYKNENKNYKDYITVKMNVPFDFVDKTPYFSCVKNPFNDYLFDMHLNFN